MKRGKRSIYFDAHTFHWPHLSLPLLFTAPTVAVYRPVMARFKVLGGQNTFRRGKAFYFYYVSSKLALIFWAQDNLGAQTNLGGTDPERHHVAAGLIYSIYFVQINGTVCSIKLHQLVLCHAVVWKHQNCY